LIAAPQLPVGASRTSRKGDSTRAAGTQWPLPRYIPAPSNRDARLGIASATCPSSRGRPRLVRLCPTNAQTLPDCSRFTGIHGNGRGDGLGKICLCFSHFGAQSRVPPKDSPECVDGFKSRLPDRNSLVDAGAFWILEPAAMPTGCPKFKRSIASRSAVGAKCMYRRVIVSVE
jgi:hypothetical protein